MKSLFTFFFALSFFAGIITMQAQGFSIGPVFGMSSSGLSSDINYDSQTWGSGFSGGVFARVPLLGINFQPELLYSKRASLLTRVNSGADTDLEVKTSTMDINLLLGSRIVGLGSAAYLRWMGGIGMSQLLNDKVRVNGSQITVANISEQVLNLHAGIGVDILLLTVNLRYERNLTDLNTSSDYSARYNTLLLSLGIKFL